MNRKLYYNRMMEELLRCLTVFLQWCAIVVCIVALVILYFGEKQIKALEDEYSNRSEIYESKYFLEGESVEHAMRRYIMSLPYPTEETEYHDNESVPVIEDFTQDDIYLLAQLMYAEEGIFLTTRPEDAEEILKLCGSVVLHRIENEYLGCKTIKDTIFCDGQYAGRTLELVKKGQDVPDIVYDWAEDLLIFGPLGPKGLIYQAEFEQGDTYLHIGNQYFGVEKYYN